MTSAMAGKDTTAGSGSSTRAARQRAPAGCSGGRDAPGTAKGAEGHERAGGEDSDRSERPEVERRGQGAAGDRGEERQQRGGCREAAGRREGSPHAGGG